MKSTPVQYLTADATAEMCEVSLRTLSNWRADKRNQFPSPVKLGGKRWFFRRAEIEAFLAAKREAMGGFDGDSA